MKAEGREMAIQGIVLRIQGGMKGGGVSYEGVILRERLVHAGRYI